MLWIILFLILVKPVSAQTPSPNTSEEIQKLREVVSQKVAEKLKQITNPSSTKKAFAAKIIQVGTNTLSVDYQNNLKTVSIDSDTVYVDIKGNKTKLANVKVGQDVLIMGNNDSSTSTFTAKRIVFIDSTTIYLKKTVVVGKIVDISRSNPIFSLIPTRNKNDLFQIKTDAKSEILDSNHQKIKVSDLKSGQKIIAVQYNVGFSRSRFRRHTS